MNNLEVLNSSSKNSLEKYKVKNLCFYDNSVAINNEITEKLSFNEKELINSINYLKVKEIEENDLIDILSPVFLSSLRVIGSKMNAQDQALLFNDLLLEIKESFSLLTIKEIEKIIKNGVRQKYGETIGFSLLNFHVWVKNYLLEKNRLNTEIQKKIDRLKRESAEFIDSDPKKTFIDQLREQYLFEKKRYLNKSQEYKSKICFDNYWMEFGCLVSGSFIYKGLLKDEMIDLKEINKVISDKKIKINQHIESNHLKLETQRKIVCAFALYLRDKKNKK